MYQAGPIPPGTGPVPNGLGNHPAMNTRSHDLDRRPAAYTTRVAHAKVSWERNHLHFQWGTIDLWWWPVLICCERKLLLTGRLKTSRTSETTLVSGLVPGSHASATAPESSSRYCKMSKLVTWHDYFSRERKKEVSPPWNPTGSVTNLMKHNKICIDERIVASPNLSGFHVLSY
jgi:hypothetical protein